jgi:hypothetical protein
MRSMKRSIIVAFFLAVAFAVTAPLVVTTASVANACTAKTVKGTCDDGPIVKPGKCADGSPGVQVALPFTGSNCIKNDPKNGGAIITYLKTILQVLSGLVGTVIVVMLVVAGIQYITSFGEPANIKSAKNRIINAVTALVLFLMMFAILGFLVPGGIL